MNFYIFQLNRFVQKFLGDLPFVSKLLGFLVLAFLIYMLFLKFKLNITKAKNDEKLNDIKFKIREEKLNTKYEKQKGKTLNAQIKNLKKESKLKKNKNKTRHNETLIS